MAPHIVMCRFCKERFDAKKIERILIGFKSRKVGIIIQVVIKK